MSSLDLALFQTLDTLDPLEDYGEEVDYSDYYNGTWEGLCDTVQNRSLVLVLGPYVHSVICVLGLIGNCLMLVPLYCAPKPSITQVLLLHLALADLVIVLVLPGLVVMELGGWSDGGAGCKMLRGGYSMSFYGAALLLAAVSADRYAAVVHARRRLSASSQAPRHLVCALVWFCAVLLSLPNFIFYESYVPKHHEVMGLEALNQTSDQSTPMVCALRLPDHIEAYSVKTALPVVQITAGFLLPLIVMSFCYGSIVATLLKGRGLSGKGRGFRRERAIRLVLMVALVFILCHAPFNIVLLIHTLQKFKPSDCESVDRLEMALSLTQTLALLHCVLNPLLYGFNSASFRTRFCGVLHKLQRQRRLSSTSQSERSTHTTRSDQSHAENLP
ncbi:C-X-C chemokine receptor type 3-like isoform X2 [Boleophthalmus pectinirostris]|uniref:C-X-C chemokine receptor type 3-like isoform X2 n=1 Tax=Boleophthalmus pectinirostris TaxID=150288 RepID=UPI00242D346A|nr:C-X-C chemokine receptor type 3-like isoform X2 [Boleophthalmus pectinirostris]XP_055005126.1 C-X-C chemokine receptor type 3-like isoform X2 [Boleophthalmus pectinirostris]